MNVACQFDHEIADNPSFSLIIKLKDEASVKLQ